MQQPFSADQIDRSLPQNVRDTMLDCILAWAALDGALSMLLAKVAGMSLADAADAIGRDSGTTKLNKIRDLLLEGGATQVAAVVRKHKKSYEKRVKPRNRIAHAKVAGMWMRDPDYIVFSVFERNADNQLAIELIPVQEVRRSTAWANAMTNMSLKIVDA